MQALYRLVARVMNTDLPVLITGESGTGKSLIARAIHDFSDRRNLPFVVVTPDDLVAIGRPPRRYWPGRGGARCCSTRSATSTPRRKPGSPGCSTASPTRRRG